MRTSRILLEARGVYLMVPGVMFTVFAAVAIANHHVWSSLGIGITAYILFAVALEKEPCK